MRAGIFIVLAHCASSSAAPPEPPVEADASSNDDGRQILPPRYLDAAPLATDAAARDDDQLATFDDAGWHVVWSDEFAGPAGTLVDPTKWSFEQGNDGWGNAELENYTDHNAALDGQGALAITARRESLGGSQYTSARLTTARLASFTYGRIEARIKVPAGQGFWPAFWLLGNDLTTAGWPACGEIDVMENLGREPSIVHGTLHGPGYSGAAGLTAMHVLLGNARYTDDFHVFAVDWTPDALRFAVDGEVYATPTRASIPRGATWVFEHPFFLVLNLAVGGTWAGSPDAATMFPQTMLVDYVRVLQR